MRPYLTRLGRFFPKLLGLLAGVALCLFSGCKLEPTENTPDSMLALYQQKVPVGTSVRAARALMEADGFTVTEAENAKWKSKRGFTFLRCTRDDGIVIKRHWEFALMHNNQVVTSVEVRPGLVYP